MGTPAEEKLTAALDAAIQDYYADAVEDGMPGGWVLLINDIGTGDGDQTGVQITYPHGSMPWAMALGIVEMGRIRLHSVFGESRGRLE